jgi:hypothetical protein
VAHALINAEAARLAKSLAQSLEEVLLSRPQILLAIGGAAALLLSRFPGRQRAGGR